METKTQTNIMKVNVLAPYNELEALYNSEASKQGTDRNELLVRQLGSLLSHYHEEEIRQDPKAISIDGIITFDEDWSKDEVIDKILEALEAKGLHFGGGIG